MPLSDKAPHQRPFEYDDKIILKHKKYVPKLVLKCHYPQQPSVPF